MWVGYDCVVPCWKSGFWESGVMLAVWVELTVSWHRNWESNDNSADMGGGRRSWDDDSSDMCGSWSGARGVCCNDEHDVLPCPGTYNIGMKSCSALRLSGTVFNRISLCYNLKVTQQTFLLHLVLPPWPLDLPHPQQAGGGWIFCTLVCS